MKRFSVLLVLLTLASPLGMRVHGQTTAAAIAAQQDAEERYKRLNAAIEDMLSAQAAQQKRVAALEDELRTARMESTRGNAQFATKADLQHMNEELLRLAKTIQEIDRKREADKRLILQTIEDLKKLIKTAAAAPVLRPPPPPPSTTASEPPPPEPTKDQTEPARDQKGFEHVVQNGETILAIIGAYNAKLKEKGVKGRITLKSVLQANPKLKPERMHIGQKVFLPEPTE